MIKGYLKMAVLHELSHGARTGYQLMKAVEEELGKKPSSGSIYPLLSGLLKKGYIKLEKKQRKKIYYLTQSGKSAIARILKEKEDMIEKHAKFCSAVEEVTGYKIKYFSGQKTRIVFDNLILIAHIKDTLVSIDKKNEKNVRQILKKTLKELQKLK